jgi:hypothetical protein
MQEAAKIRTSGTLLSTSFAIDCQNPLASSVTVVHVLCILCFHDDE